MNYTEKYHLPQWEETDRIMRSDFNEAMAEIEEGMTAAQTSADAAAVKQYVAGSYLSDESAQFIKVGFWPRAVLICKANLTSTDTSGAALFVSNINENAVSFVTDGFYVRKPSDSYPQINKTGNRYCYIAFR